jgi:hypothetical protein
MPTKGKSRRNPARSHTRMGDDNRPRARRLAPDPCVPLSHAMRELFAELNRLPPPTRTISDQRRIGHLLRQALVAAAQTVQ